MIYVGIDPGKNGGIAILSDEGSVHLGEKELLKSVLRRQYDYGKDYKFVMEAVHAMPGQGVVSMFNFGQEFGFLKGMFYCFDIEPILVTPQQWQRHYVPLGLGEKVNRKNLLKEKAKELFPEYVKQINLKNCDALLLAHYAKHYLGV